MFSYKYKSSKPSIVEYVYQVKDNIKTENKFQLLKGKEKNFEEKRKQMIHKRRLFEWTFLFCPAFFEKESNMNRFQIKT